ncbi:MAG: signal recognition particle-docking protein FtsY [Methanobacterium sp.]|nr:signal recognition particle-docking protein FtsY [Methanobacterium sp.]
MFESLKKKFTGTIGKISDKIITEEDIKVATNKTDVAKSERSESFISNEKSDTKLVDDKLAETEPKIEEEKNSGIMSFLRGKSNESGEIKYPKTIEEESSELETLISDKTEVIKPETSESDDKSGIFSFVKNKAISAKDIDDILFELELALLEGDVAMDVAEEIINSVKQDLIGRKIRRRSDVTDFTREALKKAISNILDIESKDVISLAENAKKSGEPLKIMFVGINGTGKTTTIAKISTYFMKMGYTPVIAASDTFRAGAIEQLTYHADKLNVKIIKHKKGADPAAVAFDAVEHAKAKDKELVLVDTAGRMQTNINLMDEMKKIKRVIRPDLIIYVGDALTGNDSVEQAQKFNDSVGIDGIILTKADADVKGGAALSIGYVIQKPILFLGVGQSYSDLIEFKPEWMVEQIIG